MARLPRTTPPPPRPHARPDLLIRNTILTPEPHPPHPGYAHSTRNGCIPASAAPTALLGGRTDPLTRPKIKCRERRGGGATGGGGKKESHFAYLHFFLLHEAAPFLQTGTVSAGLLGGLLLGVKRLKESHLRAILQESVSTPSLSICQSSSYFIGVVVILRVILPFPSPRPPPPFLPFLPLLSI